GRGVVGRRSRSVILGVEAPTCRAPGPNYARIERDPELRRFAPGVRATRPRLADLRFLLSWKQFRHSCRAVRTAGQIQRTARESWSQQREGFLHPSPLDVARQQPGWNLPASIRQMMELGYPTPFDTAPRSVRDFALLLNLLRGRGVRTIVIATPMPEEARDYWRRSGCETQEQEALAIARRLAAQYGASFVDFSSVKSFGGDPREFYDAMHPTVVNT